MSAIKSVDNLPNDGEKFDSSKVALVKGISLILGGGLTALFFILWLFLPGQMQQSMAYSWLFAVVFFMTLSIGGIFWTLLHHATNSGWGVVVRRLMETLGSLIPLYFILALPLLLPGPRDALWEWFEARQEMIQAGKDHSSPEHLEAAKAEWGQSVAAAEKKLAAVKAKKEKESATATATAGEKYNLEQQVIAAEGKLEVAKASEPTAEELASEGQLHANVGLYKKRGYLNEVFWYARYVGYFLVLGGIIYFLRSWSIKQDQTGDFRYFRWMRRGSCGFLPLFAASWTFVVVDWLMALDYTWFSTMWGVYLFAGSALNSMAILIAALTWLRSRGFLKDVVSMEHYHIMGKLMFSFVVFWAYIAFSQFFLIWYANITEETKFYLTRNTAYWNAYAIGFLVIGHFFLPFAGMLLRRVKTVPYVLTGIALWNLCMHVLDIYWIIIPERGPSLTQGKEMVIPGAIYFDILAFVAVGGLTVFLFLSRLAKASLYPCQDPRLEESLNLVN